MHDYWTCHVIKQVIKSIVFNKQQKSHFNISYRDPEKGPGAHCLSGSYMTISGGEHKVFVQEVKAQKLFSYYCIRN